MAARSERNFLRSERQAARVLWLGIAENQSRSDRQTKSVGVTSTGVAASCGRARRRLNAKPVGVYMRKLPLIATVCFAACAANAGTSGAAGGGHGGGSSATGGHSNAAAVPSGAGHSGGSSAAHAPPAIGTRIGSPVGTRAAALRVESTNRVTIAGREALVATVKLHAPLTDAQREVIRFHGFTHYHPGDVKEGTEVWCPDTLWSRERGTSTCVAFVR
jgi:hypothetical protein